MSKRSPWSVLRTLRREDSGSILIETALVISVLSILVLLVYDFGSVFVRKMQITNALRAGTQYALVRKPVGGDVSHIREAVLGASPVNADYQTVTAEFYCECADGSRLVCSDVCSDGSDRASFTHLTYDEIYTMMFRYPGLGSSYKLHEEATVRLN